MKLLRVTDEAHRAIKTMAAQQGVTMDVIVTKLLARSLESGPPMNVARQLAEQERLMGEPVSADVVDQIVEQSSGRIVKASAPRMVRMAPTERRPREE